MNFSGKVPKCNQPLFSVFPITSISKVCNKECRCTDKKAKQEQQQKNNSYENVISFTERLNTYE